MSEKKKLIIYISVIAIVIASVGILLGATSCDDKKENEGKTTVESGTTTSDDEETTEDITSGQNQAGETTTEEQTTEEPTTEQPTTEEPTTEPKNLSDASVEEFARALLTEYQLEVNNVDGIKRICIDPGHQGKGNNNHEPIGPEAAETKKRVSYGTAGAATGIAEYQFNLELSLMLKEELILRGYEVVMVRETNDIDISNAQRAIFGNNSGADIAVRIHANGSEDSSVHGALTIYPTENNAYIPRVEISKNSKLLSEKIIDSLCSATGAKNRGALGRDSYTGSNWSKIPVTIVENGYMSNPEEDKLLATEAYRVKLVKGIADGIDEYFNSIDSY